MNWNRPALLGAATAIAACGGGQNALAPAGEPAGAIASLWWVMFALGAAVWAVVSALVVRTMFFQRTARLDGLEEGPARTGPLGSEIDDRAPASYGEGKRTRRSPAAALHPSIARNTAGDQARARWVVAGVVISLVILFFVFGYSLYTGRTIQGMAHREPLTLEVIGHQWWWEVRYHDPDPSRRFETANEIRIPVGETVRIDLRSADVIHSFWVARLGGKLDLVPGRTNTHWLRADEPGTYRGQCAEFCGLQHANMAFVVRAEPRESFDAWVDAQLRPAAPPGDSVRIAGERVFMTRGCVLCHTVRGTEAQSDLGPDLTHIASRISLGAGILPNTRGHLAGWITNPQALKPGNLMPRVKLDADELNALLAYLNGLQ